MPIRSSLLACNLILLAAPSIAAQSPPKARLIPLDRVEEGSIAEKYLETASRITGRALLCNHGYENLRYLCDQIGARLTGSPEAERAVKWCQERMKEEGFENVRGESVMVPVWVRGKESVFLKAPREAELVACALGGSIGTESGPVEGAVVEVEDIAALQKLDASKVRGRMVYFNRKMERNGGAEKGYGATVSIRTRGAVEAAKMGAIAVAIRSVGTDQQRLTHTGMMAYQDSVPRIPAVALAQEDADLVHRLIEKGEEVHLSMELGCKTLPDVESANVVAEIVGREKPEEIVLVSGHLDSWDLGTGALDDGAGSIIAWEAARLLIELNLKPRRTVRVVLFMNEENGLRGGRGYVEKHTNELERHVAAMECDSGSGRPEGFSVGRTRSESLPAARAQVEQIAKLLQGIGASNVTIGGSGGADIAPMYERGVPCIGLDQDGTYYFDYHHSPADTFDKVDPHDLALNIAAVSVMLYVLADSEPALHLIKALEGEAASSAGKGPGK